MALGELGFPLPDFLRERAQELLTSGNPRYTPNAGLLELREAIAHYYEEMVQPDQICVCNGAEEALYILMTALINPSDTVAIPDPDYPAYPAIVKMMEAQVLRLPYEQNLTQIDWDLWDSLLSRGVKLLLLSNPKNPTGLFFDSNEMDKLVGLCRKHDIILVIDEIYRELYFTEQPISALGRYEKLFVISGLSKSHLMSGWRLGWIVSPQSFATACVKTKQYISTCSNWLSQQLGICALSDEGMSMLPKLRAMLHHTQKEAYAALQERYPQMIVPPASPYIMFKPDRDELDFATEMAVKGVVTVPGMAFGEISRAWIRINHALAMDALKEGLKSLLA